MGTPVRNHREYRVTIRLTGSEHDQLLRQMEQSGYLSMSRYFRVRCLEGKSALDGEYTASDLSGQINVLAAEISKIGTDYNKVVREFRRVLPQTRKDGTPVINTKAAMHFLQMLNTKTLEVKALMEHIIDLHTNGRPSTLNKQS